MKTQVLLFFLLFSFTFTAKAQLRLISGGSTRTLVNSGGGIYAQAITLTAHARLETRDNKEYTLTGNITGAFDLTADLFANSKVILTDSPAYTGSTVVTGGELVLTNTSNFRSFNLNVSTGATLTIDASAYGSTNSSAPYSVFGSDFTSNFMVTGGGQVNFKGATDKYYTAYSSAQVTGAVFSTAKSIAFNMGAGGQLNIDGGDWLMRTSGTGTPTNNLGNLNVAANTKFTIHGTTVQFNKLTGAGHIKNSATAEGNMTIKIGADNGTCVWDGIFSEASFLGVVKKISLEKMGTGTITFTGNNLQTGTVTITEGSLAISNGDPSGTIVNNATLILSHPGNYNLNYNISGTGNVVKKGDGDATLAGGNTGIVAYTGITTVESGVLTLRCKELKNSGLTVMGGATLVTAPNSTNNGEVASTGSLSLVSNAAMHFRFTTGSVPFTKIATSGISAPNGFRIRFSGNAASFREDNITLIRCSGTLPTVLPKIVENSIDHGAGIRKCITLNWVNGTGLVATIAATGPVINPASASICKGATQQFTIGTGTGGTPATPAWTSLNPNIVSVSADGLATGLRIGESVVIYTNTSGCVVTSPIRINGHTIRPENPQAAFCQGDVVTLKAYDSPAGGTNSVFNPAWTSDHPLIATVAGDSTQPRKPEGHVTLLTPGRATIKFKDHNGCFSEYEMTVKTAPTITPANAAICPGSSIYLRANTPPLGTTWTSSNTQAVSFTSPGFAYGAVVGDATITFRANNGCNATALLSVRTSATIARAGEDKEICGGSSVTLGAPAQNGLTYLWSPATALSAVNVADPVATPTATTTYTVTANFSNPLVCQSASEQVEVKVNPLPVITSAQGTTSQFQSETAVNLTATTDGTATSWVSSDLTKVTVAAGTDFKTATANGAAVGNAVITYTDAKGCVATHAITIFNRTPQTITFAPIPDKTVGDPNFPLLASTTSGLLIIFTTTSDKVTIITGNIVKIEKAGRVGIQANQAGNETYNSATLVNSFCINPVKPTISNNNKILTSSADANQWYKDGTAIEGATGKTYTAMEDGSYTVKAIVDDCASVFSDPISPNKSTQTITFNLITDKTVGDPDFPLSASTTSELPITFITTSDKVIVTGNSVKIVKAGKVAIQAIQAGNYAFNPATQTSNIFCIKPAKPSITINDRTLTSLADNGNQWYLNGTLIVGATGKTHTATVEGNYSVKVTIEDCASDFSDPQSVSAPGKSTQMITFPPITDKTVGDPDFDLPATTNSNLPLTFSSPSDKLTITENRAKIVKAGKASIHANQAGNDTYNPATQISNTFCINPAKPTISTSNKTLTSSVDEGNQWFINGNAIEGATGKTHAATLDGDYTLKVTVEDCASAISDSTPVMVTGDISGDELRIFPNPVHDQLVIELPFHENGLISLFSVAGQNLYATAAAGKAIISMKDFPAGIYILKIQTAGKMSVRKVVRN